MYKIIDIKHKNTGKTREDGRYPLRIGSLIEFDFKPFVGNYMFYNYIADKDGHPKEGTLRTSLVFSVHEEKDILTVTTFNSIYEFENLNHPWRKACDYIREEYGEEIESTLVL